MKHLHNFIAQLEVALLSVTLAPLFPFLCNKTDARGVAVPDIVQILKSSMFYLPSLGAALTQLVFQAPLKRGNGASKLSQYLGEGNICEF